MNIVITGASRGIGKAITERFAAEPNNFFLSAKNDERLQIVCKELSNSYPDSAFRCLAADLSIETEIQSFAGFCLKYGCPDILVNNAGTYLPGSVTDENTDSLQSMLATNLMSAYHLTRALVPSMRQHKSGHIFNICSIAGLQAYEGGGSYSISKYALHGFSQNLRNELKKEGIKVTGVYPGAVLTDAWGDFDNSENRIMEARDVAEMIFAAAKLSPGATVEDIILRPQAGDL